MTVDARHLRAFVAIATQGTITGAAVSLHLTQPAVSRLLKQLETHLGTALVERSTHHLRLTDAGERYAVSAAAALRALDSVLGSDALQDRPIRIGHAWSGLGERTGQLLADWQRLHPESPVLMRRFDDRLAGLLSGEVDAAVLRGTRLNLPVHRQALPPEPRVAALPAEHPLATQTQVTLADLREEPLVLSMVAGTTPADLWGSRAPDQAGPRVRNTDDWLFAIAAGQGVGVTSVASTAVYASPGVVYRPLVDAPEISVELVWPEPPTHPLLAEFVAHLKPATDRSDTRSQA